MEIWGRILAIKSQHCSDTEKSLEKLERLAVIRFPWKLTYYNWREKFQKK